MAAWSDVDLGFMREALSLADEAGNEVPVGAVVVRDRTVIGRGANRTETHCDPSAHAEIVALRDAADRIGNHRLTDAALYVTLEPCTMCVGAIVQARLRRVVFGAYDRRAGALGSAIDLTESPAFNHRFEVNGGLLPDEAEALLKRFFAARR